MPILYKLIVDPGVLDECAAWRVNSLVDIKGVERYFIRANSNQGTFNIVRNNVFPKEMVIFVFSSIENENEARGLTKFLV